jgi:tRNA uridine 5-carboxymethylaminomethyl modification enzyme
MFTSRAEYRLSLRADNADRRLTVLGIRHGLAQSERAASFAAKAARIAQAERRLHDCSATPSQARAAGLQVSADGSRRTAYQLLSLPGVDFARLLRLWPELADVQAEVREQLENDAQYAVYLGRQDADIAAFRRDEALRLPADLDYAAVRGISTEAGQKLSAIRPATLGQASRIDGVTPAALTLVLAHMRSRSRGNRADDARTAVA